MCMFHSFKGKRGLMRSSNKYHGRSEVNQRSSLIWASFFALAIAFVEAAVVVYLRKLYYPGGFGFPLKMIPQSILWIELGRELATIIMLMVVVGLIGHHFRQKLAYFAFLFGMWDIFYYVWLKIYLNWPSFLLEWNVLFLIPLPWVGPVLAPILVSLGLIFSAIVILLFYQKGNLIVIKQIGLVRWGIICNYHNFYFLWSVPNVLQQQLPRG